MQPLRVEVLQSLQAVARLREPIDALNAASRRPCPFATFEYLAAFLAHDEHGAREDELRFYAAFEGDRLAGYLPLRKFRDRMAGLPFGRIGMLISHDTDRPHAVARSEDEPRVCRAFYDELLLREPGWDLVEFAQQDAASGLGELPPLDPLRHSARRLETMPNSTVPLPFTSIADYQRGLSKNRRHESVRHCRKLFAAGRVEALSCTDPRGRAALLDLYLDLERRSWKEKARAGIRRHPERVAFFRSLCGRDQPLQLELDFVLLDGVPVCGLVSGAFEGTLYALETAFDDAYAALGPGHLLTLLVMRRCITRADRAVNFDGNYAYYKERLGAVVTPTFAVQIFRVGSAPWVRALAGDLKRRLLPPRDGSRWNPERRRVAQAGADGAPERSLERQLAASVLRDLAARGIRVERLAGDSLERALPFAVAEGRAA